jgi:hypothetical protein
VLPLLRATFFVWDFALPLSTNASTMPCCPPADRSPTYNKTTRYLTRSRRHQLEYPVLGFILLSARPRRSSNRVCPVVLPLHFTAFFAVERYLTDVRRRCQTRTRVQPHLNSRAVRPTYPDQRVLSINVLATVAAGYCLAPVYTFTQASFPLERR